VNAPEKDIPGDFRPRILVINSARKFIGEAAHSIALCEGLIRRGFQVVLVCRRGYQLEQEAVKRGIPCYAVRMNSRFNGIHDLLDLLALRRIIEKHRIDIIHCHRGKDHWLAACTRLFTGKTVLVRTRHVLVPVKNHIFNRWLYKRGTDGVIAVSHRAAESLEGLPLPEKPSVIYAAVDAERFAPEKRSEMIRRECGVPEGRPDAPLVGLVGRIQRVKGQSVFLKAAARICRAVPSARFVIAGRGSEEKRRALRDLAGEEGISDHLCILDWMDNIEGLIASLDVGVVASRGSEGSSRITMEYMASGVPVVSTCVGGIPELLEEGKLGFLVEPNDPSALSLSVIRAILKTDGTEEKKELAFKKARGFLSMERFLEETLRFYHGLISPPSSD